MSSAKVCTRIALPARMFWTSLLSPLYCDAMECGDLQRLRQRACQLGGELKLRRRNTRAYVARSAPGQPITADYEWFLQRQLQKAADAIEHHLAQHQCQG